jgi:hypothetical protein
MGKRAAEDATPTESKFATTAARWSFARRRYCSTVADVMSRAQGFTRSLFMRPAAATPAYFAAAASAAAAAAAAAKERKNLEGGERKSRRKFTRKLALTPSFDCITTKVGYQKTKMICPRTADSFSSIPLVLSNVTAAASAVYSRASCKRDGNRATAQRSASQLIAAFPLVAGKGYRPVSSSATCELPSVQARTSTRRDRAQSKFELRLWCQLWQQQLWLLVKPQP